MPLSVDYCALCKNKYAQVHVTLRPTGSPEMNNFDGSHFSAEYLLESKIVSRLLAAFKRFKYKDNGIYKSHVIFGQPSTADDSFPSSSYRLTNPTLFDFLTMSRVLYADVDKMSERTLLF
jgi:hypothetical protein